MKSFAKVSPVKLVLRFFAAERSRVSQLVLLVAASILKGILGDR